MRKTSKYGNKKTRIGAEKFDSKAEARRWSELKLLEKAGIITDLCRQVPFEIAPEVVLDGRKRPARKYLADFTYRENGALVVEDCKGARTDVYTLKRHLMKAVCGIEVKETGRRHQKSSKTPRADAEAPSPVCPHRRTQKTSVRRS